MASWPSILPGPQVPGYMLKPVQAFDRTQMDDGPARQRRRFRQPPTKIPVSFLLTSQLQMAVFEAWYYYELDDGAGWFTVALPNGQGSTSCETRFTKVWEASLISYGNWQVTAEFEIRIRPLMTELELAPYL